MSITKILNDLKREDGVYVEFDGWGYYAHSIGKIGAPEDNEGDMNSMWSWVNHCRHKIWWNDEIEKDFILRVSKYFT